MSKLRPVIGEIRCVCGKTQMVARNGMRIVATEKKLLDIGHVARSKRRQAWGAVDREVANA